MAHCVDLEQLSLDELVSLANRVECRIRYLTANTTSETVNDPNVRTSPVSGGTNSMSSAPASGKVEDPGVGTTLSERVQGLIQTNDPWEGSGVGPTKWSQPLYGGHIICTPEVLGVSPRVHSVHDPLPVFGARVLISVVGSLSRLVCTPPPPLPPLTAGKPCPVRTYV